MIFTSFLSDKLQGLKGEDRMKHVVSPEEEILGMGAGVEPSPEKLIQECTVTELCSVGSHGESVAS